MWKMEVTQWRVHVGNVASWESDHTVSFESQELNDLLQLVRQMADVAPENKITWTIEKVEVKEAEDAKKV